MTALKFNKVEVYEGVHYWRICDASGHTIGEMQKDAMQTMGAINPLTDMGKLSNTLKAMTELAGFKDTSQFWGDPTQFQPPPKEDKPNINEQLISVQIQQIQADIQKKAAELDA